MNVSIINNQDTSYLLNLTLGSPAQNFTLALDTGSSDLWVIGGSKGGNDIYESGSSSSYKSLDIGYNATYADGTTALGVYATDTLSLGGATVKDFQFIVVNQTSSDVGIAGVGYNISTYAASHLDKGYNNLPYALTAAGITKSTAYSLWMNGVNNETGTILFGGVNKAQYTGELQTLPIVPVYNQFYSLAIALTEVTVQTGDATSTNTNLPLAVSLDTGSTLSLLPQDLVNDILKPLNGTYDKTSGFAYVDCNLMSTDYNVTFGFSGAKVDVGLSQLVLNQGASQWPKGSCMLGIMPSEPGVNILGDTFLRSAYVVYDLENNEISLANTNFNPGKDDIHEISTGTNAVPGASLVPSAVSSATGNGVQTATTGVPTGPVTTGSATGSATTGGSAKSTGTSSGMAVLPTGNAKNLLSGLAGVGLLLAL